MDKYSDESNKRGSHLKNQTARTNYNHNSYNLQKLKTKQPRRKVKEKKKNFLPLQNKRIWGKKYKKRKRGRERSFLCFLLFRNPKKVSSRLNEQSKWFFLLFSQSLFIVYAVKNNNQIKTKQNELTREMLRVVFGALLAFGSDREIAYV